MPRSVVARSALARPLPRPRRRGKPRPAAPGVSLTEQAYRALEEQIVTLRIPPGTVVSEAILGERLGFGRTPIREALWRLARERLVTIIPHRGIIVSEIHIKPQLRLLELRRVVERLVAARAAKRASEAERRRLDEIAAGMEKAAAANDDTEFMRLDREFNELTVAAARNEFASSAMSLMQGLSRRFWYLHYKEAADMPLAARLHADVARAIARGDGDGAGRASDALMDYIEDFARATIGID
ncbi:MAG TPA: GntR family transcriptional regulator [Stellaceae bacterium]|nr:GntR family transcriptional regulator [Stellaceae bacterium]